MEQLFTFADLLEQKLNKTESAKINQAKDILDNMRHDMAKLANISKSILQKTRVESLSSSDEDVVAYDIAEQLYHFAATYLQIKKQIP